MENKYLNFPTQLCLGIMSTEFSATESREISLNRKVYGFLVDYNSVGKSVILNIHKYLINKNNIKRCSPLLNKCLFYY